MFSCTRFVYFSRAIDLGFLVSLGHVPDLLLNRDIVQHDVESGKHPEAMTKLLERQLNDCGMSIPFPALFHSFA